MFRLMILLNKRCEYKFIKGQIKIPKKRKKRSIFSIKYTKRHK
jgi:hypothetical protein